MDDGRQWRLTCGVTRPGTVAGGDDVEHVEDDAALLRPDEDDQLRLDDPRVVVQPEAWPRRWRERE